MIVDIQHKPGAESATVWVGSGYGSPEYRVTVAWQLGQTYADAVRTVLALLGSDVQGPVIVSAGGLSNSTARFVVLNGPACIRQADEACDSLGIPRGSVVSTVHLATPAPLETGERVQLSPSYWPALGQYATVVKRIGALGVKFRVKGDTGVTHTITRGAVL